jgi:hypothetical protein
MNTAINMYEILNNKMPTANKILCCVNVCVIIYLLIDSLYLKKKNQKKEPKKMPENKWNIWTEENRYTERDVDTWYIIPGKAFCRYKGEWINGLAHGKGVKEIFGTNDVSHSIMVGNFKTGYINGYGKQIYDITSEQEEFEPYYEGEFKMGIQHGMGTYYYGTGCYRRGTLVDGKFDGRGIYYDHYKNRTWIGTYVDDVRDNGIWYDGEQSLDKVPLEEEENMKPKLI